MLSRPPVTTIPHDALVFFPDGNMMCAVNGDFDNLQESPAGFGEGMLEALDSLHKDLVAEHDEVLRRAGLVGKAIDGIRRSQGMTEFQIHVAGAERQMRTWPKWKRETNWLDNRPNNATPRPHVDNTGDDGGY